MNQSGSRFTSQQPSYYEPQQYSSSANTNTNPTSYISSPNPNFPPQPQQNQGPFLNNPIPNQQQQQSPFKFQVQHSVEIQPLLMNYTAEQRAKIKVENKQKYNMNPQSIVYKLPPQFLQSLVYKFPSDFPSQLRDELPRNLSNIRSDFDKFRRLFFGGVLYWLSFRRFAWFKLTGSPIMRFCFGFLCINNMMELAFTQREYLTLNSFVHNLQIEDAIRKHNINVTSPNRLDMAS